MICFFSIEAVSRLRIGLWETLKLINTINYSFSKGKVIIKEKERFLEEMKL